MVPCLRQFYRVAYDGEYNCTKNFSFFSTNPENQSSSFKIGKSCFLEVAKEECTAAQYSYLSTKYDQFLETISKEPTGENVDCSNKYFKYGIMKCEPMMNDFSSKAAAVNKIDTKINDTRVLHLIEQCENIISCVEPKCFVAEDKLASMKEGCIEIRLKNSEFMDCQNKIKKQSPDLSEYTCLDGLDFTAEDFKTEVELLTLKKDCMKQIMEDICGEKSVANYDSDCHVALENVKRSARMSVVINEDD